jgi:hypothetical protein
MIFGDRAYFSEPILSQGNKKIESDSRTCPGFPQIPERLELRLGRRHSLFDTCGYDIVNPLYSPSYPVKMCMMILIPDKINRQKSSYCNEPPRGRA